VDLEWNVIEMGSPHQLMKSIDSFYSSAKKYEIIKFTIIYNLSAFQPFGNKMETVTGFVRNHHW
jgi:hypothetical protein